MSAGGSLTIQGGSVFRSNQAVGTGNVRTGFGGWIAGSAAGGGLYVNGASNVTISDSTFTKNIHRVDREKAARAARMSMPAVAATRTAVAYTSPAAVGR